MVRRIGRRLTYANVVATAALFVALGGTAAASFIITSNSQIGPGTVSGAKPPSGDGPNIIAGSIFTTDLANGAVTNAKLGASAVNGSKVKDGSLTGADLAADTITGAQIDESTLGTVPSAGDAASLGGTAASGYQRRVGGTCAGGTAVSAIAPDGSVSCNEPTEAAKSFRASLTATQAFDNSSADPTNVTLASLDGFTYKLGCGFTTSGSVTTVTAGIFVATSVGNYDTNYLGAREFADTDSGFSFYHGSFGNLNGVLAIDREAVSSPTSDIRVFDSPVFVHSATVAQQASYMMVANSVSKTCSIDGVVTPTA